MPSSSALPSRARRRVLGSFAAFGLCWGAWGAVLPAVRAEAGVSDGQLGVALLFVGVGALASMRATGAILDRSGALALPAVLALLAVTLVLPGFASSLATLCVALALLGVASGAADVAINAEGVRAEAATGRAVMNLAHGVFSVAVVVGALLAGGLRQLDAGAELVLTSTAALILLLSAMVAATPAAGDRDPARAASLRGLPRPLLILGVLCALAFFVENAWQSWGAIYLEDELGASALIGALAPALFAASAATARIGAHGLAGRAGETTLLRAGALLGALGTVGATVAGYEWLALAGVMAAGAGISICAPILFSIAGRGADESVRATAVSIVTTIAYLGFVVGPAAVGLLAEATTLRLSLAAVAAVALAVAAFAGSASSPRGDAVA